MNATEGRRLCFGVISTGGLASVVAAAVFRVSAPRPNLANSPTNVVVGVSRIHWQRPVTEYWPRSVPEPVPVQREGIEPAERINSQMMRRYQEHWNRSEKPQVPLPPALPGIKEEGK